MSKGGDREVAHKNPNKTKYPDYEYSITHSS